MSRSRVYHGIDGFFIFKRKRQHHFALSRRAKRSISVRGPLLMSEQHNRDGVRPDHTTGSVIAKSRTLLEANRFIEPFRSGKTGNG